MTTPVASNGYHPAPPRPVVGTRFRRSPEVVGVAHGDRTVLMDLASAQYFTLDVVGAAVWELLDQPRGIDELTDALGQQFDAPAEQIRQDVSEFLSGLVRDGLAAEVR